MSDPMAPTTSESTAEMMQSLTKYLPAFMKAQNAEVLPQAETELAAAQKISDPYQRLLTDLYNKYAPELATTGTKVENINRTGAAKTDLDIMRGSGKELVTEAQALDKQLNPEVYATKEAAGKQLSNLLGAVDVDGGTHEAERLVNREALRSGNSNVSSQTGTVANALAFGDERMKRMDALSNTIGQATNFIQGAQGQFNPITTALNRPSTNTGSNQFGGTTKPGDQAYASGNNMYNNMNQNYMNSQNINANRRTAMDTVDSAMGMINV